jgi:hypothetical protein
MARSARHPGQDAHLDLAYLDLMGPAVEADHPTPAARGVSLPALVRGGVRIALGTIFTEFGSGGAAWGYGRSWKHD